MDRLEKAVQLFSQGYNCCQSVFAAYADLFGLKKEDLALSIAAAFGGGYGRLQKTCGAVSGGLMVLGCIFYKGKDKKEAKSLTYEKTREFIRIFEDRFGSISCYELLGLDFNTEEGQARFNEQNLSKIKCERYVRETCIILEEKFFKGV